MEFVSEKNNVYLTLGWTTLVAVAAIFVAILHPLSMVFDFLTIAKFGQCEIICFGILLIDASVRFFPNPLRHGVTISGKQERLSGAIDVLAVLPFGWPVFFDSISFLVLLPLLKLVPINQRLMVLNRQFDFSPIAVRLFLFALWVLMLAHWAACGWVALETTAELLIFDKSTYIRCLYWSITTLTTVGYGDISPEGDSLRIYSMVVMVIGVAVYGFVVGNIASIFSNMDLAEQSHRERVDNVMAYMRYQEIPKDLQRRAAQYFDYAWESRADNDDQGVLEALPESMRTDVLVYLHRDLVQNVPFFKEAGDAFISALIPHLKNEVWVPGQTIFQAGDSGNHMYFISSGQVEIASNDGVVLGVLQNGDFFGEIALIAAGQRQATARSVTYCTICALAREE